MGQVFSIHFVSLGNIAHIEMGATSLEHHVICQRKTGTEDKMPSRLVWLGPKACAESRPKHIRFGTRSRGALRKEKGR